MFWVLLIAGATLFVSYANGANDNFKGVATLYGSGVAGYRTALWWATVTTFAGSVAACFLATELIPIFQGKGLVPTALAESHSFAASVILGAALTVMLATKIGIPISTTHSLAGALFGGGFVAAGWNIGFDTLAESFFLPLLLSPLVAAVLAGVAYPMVEAGLRCAGFTKENCVCIGNERGSAAVIPEGYVISEGSRVFRLVFERKTECSRPHSGALFGVDARSLIDLAHFLSAGAASFARGLNDAPKMVALGLLVGFFDVPSSIGLVALVMALGGLLGARRVAETISNRITVMEGNHGFAANVVTSFLVIFASAWGLPVSTTHVSCGALFGIGFASGGARYAVIRSILLAWVLTLPVAALFAGGIFAAIRHAAMV